MDFSQALVGIKAGERVRRTGWNTDHFVFLALNVPGTKPHLLINQGDGVIPFTPGPDSLLAEDWEVVPAREYDGRGPAVDDAPARS